MRGQFGGPSSRGVGARSDKTKVALVAAIFLLLLLSTAGVGLIYAGSSKAAAVKTVVVEKEPEVKMVDVLIPLRTIEAGAALEPTMFRRESRPAVGLPSRAIKDFEEIKGQFARSLIVPDQPLHRDYITINRPANALTIKIPDGYRAVAISVDAKSSVEGWARPGARVDVVWASSLRGQAAVTVIVPNAQILSAERRMTTIDPKDGMTVPSTITLLVAAPDAAKIQLAQQTGSLSLILRGDTDPGKSDNTLAGSFTIDDLYPKSGDAPAPAPLSGPRIRMRNSHGELEEYVLKDGRLISVQAVK